MTHDASPSLKSTWHHRVSRGALIAIASVGLVWLSGVRLFAFRGNSMIPAVMPDDHFVGMVGLWKRTEPKRFDMLIFDLPEKSAWAHRKIPWMKRLVGLPGEQLRLSGDALFINGDRVDAPFLRSKARADVERSIDIKLGENEFFVLGDNLDHSLEDSRSFGPLQRDLIKGYVGMVIHGSGKRKE
jgi:signal peptidase I